MRYDSTSIEIPTGKREVLMVDVPFTVAHYIKKLKAEIKWLNLKGEKLTDDWYEEGTK